MLTPRVYFKSTILNHFSMFLFVYLFSVIPDLFSIEDKDNIFPNLYYRNFL